MRILPLVALPCAAVFLYLTVSVGEPLLGHCCALPGLCLRRGDGGSILGRDDAPRAIGHDGGDGHPEHGWEPGRRGGDADHRGAVGGPSWSLVFATGAATSVAAAALWLTIDAGRGELK